MADSGLRVSCRREWMCRFRVTPADLPSQQPTVRVCEVFFTDYDIVIVSWGADESAFISGKKLSSVTVTVSQLPAQLTQLAY